MPHAAPLPRRIRPHPAEWATLAILAVVTVTIGVAVVRGVPMGRELATHAALLAGFGAVTLWLARRPGWRWTAHVRGVAVIAVMFTLYSTLAHVAFDAVPWIGDAALEAADRALLLGHSPAMLVDGRVGPRGTELLSFFYGAYIPYLWLTILLGLLGRPAEERDEFVTGFALLYLFSFLGYLFVPARGPVVHLAGEFSAPLQGGTFHRMVVEGIDSMGGPHGAFPSLHVGASFFAAWFDWRHRNLLRALIYVPLVALIAVATIVLRYHWVVDLVAGVLLALLATRLAPRLIARWRGREAAA